MRRMLLVKETINWQLARSPFALKHRPHHDLILQGMKAPPDEPFLTRARFAQIDLEKLGVFAR